MGNIRRRLLGWSECDAASYRECYSHFGGSVITHPDVICFLSSRKKLRASYFCKKKDGVIISAFPLIENRMSGLSSWKDYPLSYDEIIFPMSREHKVIFPEKVNILSPEHRNNLLNASYGYLRHKNLCIIKDSFSSKHAKNRRNEFNRFIRAGGQCIPVSAFTPSELTDLYIRLFRLRFGGALNCYSYENLKDILDSLNHMLSGYVLFVGDSPCAIDIVFKAESYFSVYYDIPNGGVDLTYQHLSPGSLLMWKNIQLAKEESAHKKCRISIGRLEEGWDYKLRWADAFRTGKTLF